MTCPFCNKPDDGNLWHVLNCPQRPKVSPEELGRLKAEHDARKFEFGDKFRDDDGDF